MSKKLMFGFLILLMAPVWATAGEGFLDIQRWVPDVMMRSGSDGVVMSCQLDSLATYNFAGFAPGSSNIPEGMVSEIKELVDQLTPNQYVFVQGRTDNMGWYDRYRPREDDRLDLILGLTRSQKVLEFIQAYRPELEDNVRLLNSVLVRDGRGVDVYVATYIDPPPSKPQEEMISHTHGEFAEIDSTLDYLGSRSCEDSGLKMGVGVGFYNVEADSNMSFSVPTANLYFVRNPFEVLLYVGWYPKDSEPVEGFGKIAESIVGGDLTVYIIRNVIGVSGGVNCAWQTLRLNDEYLEKSLGFYAGPKISVGIDWLDLQAGVNFQRANLNTFDGFPYWENGYSYYVSAHVMFPERRDK